MEPLSNLQVIVGFFSYSRDDDRDLNGGLSTLRQVIQAELRSQLGRKNDTFQLWQDKVDIATGTRWRDELKAAVDQAVFFIPIITPTSVASPHCKFEIESFIAREAELGRRDLMFPLLCIPVPELEDEISPAHPVLHMIRERQYFDWCRYRFSDANSPELRVEIAKFCLPIANALRRRAAVQGAPTKTPPKHDRPPIARQPRPGRKWTRSILLGLLIAALGAGGYRAWTTWQQAAQEARTDAALNETFLTSRTTRDQAARDQAARDQAARDQAARDQAARDQAARDQARDQAARDQAARDQAARERVAREQASREQASREQAARDQASREQATRDQAAREQAARDQAAREQAARDQAARDQAARDQAAREQAAREQASQQEALRNLNALLGVGTTFGSRRWTTLEPPLPCYSNAKSTYDVTYADGHITWTSGTGDVDQERIQSISEQSLTTLTIASDHRSGRAEVTGTSWEYRASLGRLSVSRNGTYVFRLRRCD